MVEVDLDKLDGLHGSSYGGWLFGQNRNLSSVLRVFWLRFTVVWRERSYVCMFLFLV